MVTKLGKYKTNSAPSIIKPPTLAFIQLEKRQQCHMFEQLWHIGILALNEGGLTSSGVARLVGEGSILK